MSDIFKKYWWLVLIIIIVLLSVILWFFLVRNTNEDIDDLTISSSTTSQTTKSAFPSNKKVEKTESDNELLKKAVSEKTGISIDIIIVDVSKNTGKYAKGLVTSKGETVGGGYWLAIKTNGKWSVVFDGQNTPECSLINPSGFPADMVPECFDSSGNIVTRS